MESLDDLDIIVVRSRYEPFTHHQDVDGCTASKCNRGLAKLYALMTQTAP